MTSKLRVNRLINKSKDFNYKSMISKIPNPNRTCLHQNPTDCFGFFHFPTPPTKKYQKLNLGFKPLQGLVQPPTRRDKQPLHRCFDVKTSCFGFPFVEKKSTQGTQGDQLRALRDLGLCDAQLWKEANLAGNVPKESLLPTFGPQNHEKTRILSLSYNI